MKKHFFILTISIMMLFNISGCVQSKKNTTAPLKDSENGEVADSLAENSYYYYIKAQLQLSLSNLDKASFYMEEAIKSDPESIFLKKELINIFLIKNQKKGALIILENMLERDPNNIDNLILYSKIKMSLEDIEAAKNIYKKILTIDDKQETIYLLLGSIYRKEEDWVNALKTYEKLVKYFPKSFEGHYYMGKIYGYQGKNHAAIKEFEKSLELEPKLEEAEFALIDLYKIQNDRKKSIKIYKKILKREPENIKASMGLGLIYHNTGYRKKAKDIFRILGKKSLSDPGVSTELARFCIEQKEYKNVITAAKGMLGAAPENTGFHYIIGLAYDGKKEKIKALSHMKKVKADSNFYQNAVIYIAFYYQEQKDIQRAIDFLTDVTKSNPNPLFFLYLGSFYEEQKEFTKAVDSLKQGIDIAPDHVRLYFRLGVVYDKWNKKEDSIENMKKVIELDPKHVNALNYLGYTYADMERNLNEAEELIMQALKLKPNDGYITDSMGWVYYKKGLYKKALEHLIKATNLVPKDPVILEHAGDIYYKLNNRIKALEFYNRALLEKKESKETLEDKIQTITNENHNNLGSPKTQ